MQSLRPPTMRPDSLTRFFGEGYLKKVAISVSTISQLPTFPSQRMWACERPRGNLTAEYYIPTPPTVRTLSPSTATETLCPANNLPSDSISLTSGGGGITPLAVLLITSTEIMQDL